MWSWYCCCEKVNTTAMPVLAFPFSESAFSEKCSLWERSFPPLEINQRKRPPLPPYPCLSWHYSNILLIAQRYESTEFIKNSSAFPWIPRNSAYCVSHHLLLGAHVAHFSPIPATCKSRVVFLMIGLLGIFAYSVFPIWVRYLWEKAIGWPTFQFIS